MQAPCAICRGLYGEIHYDEPSDSNHPLSFVIDEIVPISLYKQYGYSSRRAAAEDWENLQPAHYYCNAMKSNKMNYKPPGMTVPVHKIVDNDLDGEW